MAKEVEVVYGRCGCKGIRTCLLCEQQTSGETPISPEEGCHVIHQCYRCGKVLPEESGKVQPDPKAPPLFSCVEPCSNTSILRAWYTQEVSCDSEPIRFEGVTIVKDFVSMEEEDAIVTTVDGWKWVESQSGRRKQVQKKYVLGLLAQPEVVKHLTTGIASSSTLPQSEFLIFFQF